MQELAVVQDLLNLLIGIEGKYITIKQQRGDASSVGKVHSPAQFQCDTTIDPSLKELVRLPARGAEPVFPQACPRRLRLRGRVASMHGASGCLGQSCRQHTAALPHQLTAHG